MRSELEHVLGRRERWRFGIGCVWAALKIRARATFGQPAPGSASARALVLIAVLAAFSLGIVGLVRYPGLRTGYNAWLSLPFFVALLAGYVVTACALAGDRTSHAATARRYGLAGGVAFGAAWFAIYSPGPLKSWVLVPLAIVLLSPPCVAALAGRAARDARAGAQAALWSGIVGGLVVFIVWVTATYLRDGRPYDPGLLRDFHRSRAPDLATYAVSDDLGSGLVLLLIVPTLALALGSLASRLAAGRSPSR